jgi:hypothetical protein
MAQLIKIEATKTYATRDNAVKAFEKKFSNSDVRYVLMQDDAGRWFPVALGEKAIQAGVHFSFNVMG